MLCVILLLSACGKEKDGETGHVLPQQRPDYTEEEYEEIDYEWEPLFDSYEDNYLVHEWTEEQTGIGRPYGICAVGDSIYLRF